LAGRTDVEWVGHPDGVIEADQAMAVALGQIGGDDLNACQPAPR
jgi:hypothetical protein